MGSTTSKELTERGFSLDPEGKHLKIITVRNTLQPDDLEVTWVKYEEGWSIADYLDDSKHDLVVSLSGGIVPREEWSLTVPKLDDSIVVAPVLEGDSVKDILRVVAFIALAVVTAGIASGGITFGGLLTGASSTTLAVVAAGVQIVGTVLINAALPMQAAVPKSNNDLNESPSYGIDGPINISKEGVVVPVIYGRHRFAGNIINLYTENIEKTQILYMLMAASEGPVAAISDIKINDQPLSQFSDIVVDIRNGDFNQEPIPWFKETITLQSAGGLTLQDWTTPGPGPDSRVTTQEVDRLRVDITAPSGFFELDDEGKLQSLEKKIVIGYRQVESDGSPLGGGSHEPISYEVGQLIVETHETRYRYINTFNLNPANGEPTLDQIWEYTDTLRAGDTVDADGRIIDVNGRVVGFQNNNPVYNNLTFSDPIFKGRSRYPIRFSWYTPEITQGYYEVFVGRFDPEDPNERVIDDLTWVSWGEIITDPVAYRNTALVGVKVRLSDQLNGVPKVTYLVDGVQCRQWDGSAWIYKHTRNPAWVAMDILMNTRYGMGVDWDEIDRDAFIDWADFCDSQTNPLRFDGVFDQRMDAWTALQYVFRAGHAQPVRNGTKYSVVTEAPSDIVQVFSASNISKGSMSESWLSLDGRANAVDVTYFDETESYKRKTLRVVDDTVPVGTEEQPAQLTMIGVTDRTRAAEEGYFHLNLNRLITKTISFEAGIEAIACIPGSVILYKGMQQESILTGRLQDSTIYGGIIDPSGKPTNEQGVLIDQEVTLTTGNSYVMWVHHPLFRLTDSAQTHQITNVDGANNVVTVSNMAGIQDISADPNDATHAIIDGTEYQVVSFDKVTGNLELEDVSGLINGLGVDLYVQDAVVQYVVNNSFTDMDVPTTRIFLNSAYANEWQENWGGRLTFLLGEASESYQTYRVMSLEPGADEYKRKITALEYNPAVYNYGSGIIPPSTPVTDPTDDPISHVQNLQITEERVYIQGQVKFNIFVSWEEPTDGIYEGAEVFGQFNNDDLWEQLIITSGGVTLHTFESRLGDTFNIRVVARDKNGERAPFSSAPTVSWTTGQSEVTDLDVTSLVGEGLFQRNRLKWQVNAPIKYHHASLFFTFDANDNPPDDINLATEIKDVAGFEYTHDNLDEGTYRYWIKAYDLTGEETAVYPPASGLEVKPLGSVDALFDALGFLVGESYLDNLLRSRIDKIPTLVDINDFQNLMDQITSLVALESTNNTLIITETATRESETQNNAAAITGLAARMDDAEAAIVSEQVVRANADSAEASARLALTARVDTAEADITQARADILTEQTARADGDSAEAASRETLAVTLTGQTSPTSDPNDLVASSLLYNERQARVSAEAAIASDVSQLNVRMGSAEGSITTIQLVNLPTLDGRVGSMENLTGGSPLVTQITQLGLDVDGNSSLIEERLEITEFQSSYALRIDNDGYVAGFGLGVESLPGSGPTSSFLVRADVFAIADAGFEPSGQPIFSVVTSPTTDPTTGVTLPAGIYLNGDVYGASGIDTQHLAQSSVSAPLIYSGGTATFTNGQTATVGLNFSGTKQNAHYTAILVAEVAGWHINSVIAKAEVTTVSSGWLSGASGTVVSVGATSPGRTTLCFIGSATASSTGQNLDFSAGITISQFITTGPTTYGANFNAIWKLVILETLR